MNDNTSEQHFSFAVNIAIEAIKSLLLVNGGAATALIALTSKDRSSADFGLAVLLFGAAALFNALTLVVGYFSQLSYANHRLYFEKDDCTEAETSIKRHEFLQHVAGGMIATSLLLSSAAMVSAFCAL